tara:strand:- start:132 stop:974 length:843 start_codon:yes stop_codon:yes gene_type:complete
MSIFTRCRSNYFIKNFIDKFKIEIDIFYDNIRLIIFFIFVLLYIASTIGRNLAYYRSIQQPRLKDLGFEIIPELPNNLKFISEVINITNLVIGVLITFSPLYFKPMKNSLSLILIAIRLMTILGIGHLIRIFMYLSTSLPSPADHCQPGSDNYNPPTSLVKVFTRFSSFKDLNCGDLIFSGHMFQSISFTTVSCVYSYRIFKILFSKIISIIQILLSLLQSYFIIAARNHYSIDIIVAIYVSATLWYISFIKFPVDEEMKIVDMKKRQQVTNSIQDDFPL